MDLQEFDFFVKYRPGRVHNNADALSRLLPYQHQVNSKSSADIFAVTLCPDINIKDAQEQDPSLAKSREWKANGLRNAPKLNTHDPYLHKMLRFYNRLFLRDGILVRALGARQHHSHYVVVVPQSLTRNIVRAMHDNPFAGHMGRAPKTALDRDFSGQAYDAVYKNILNNARLVHNEKPQLITTRILNKQLK